VQFSALLNLSFNPLEAIALSSQRVTINIGIIRDPGHPEPWIIATSAKPGYLTTLGYADRWGICETPWLFRATCA
jgi:hypothetical protein